MKAVGLTKFGGPEVLEIINLPDDLPGPDEVIIHMRAAGVNFADIYRRRGEYPIEPPSPFVLGHEGAGVIFKVGINITDFKIGDRVAFTHVSRSNGEFVKAPGWKVVPLPSEVNFEMAAALLLQGLTAHYLTRDSFPVKANHRVLIHSASGGVGLFLVQLCALIGAKVIGTVSCKEKVSLVKQAGANEVLVRSGLSWVSDIQNLTTNQGVDVVYDALGSTLRDSIEVVRERGTVVYYGWAGGKPKPVDPNVLMDGSKTLVGGDLWGHIATRNELIRRSRDLFSLVSAGDLKINIQEKFPLTKVAEAHRLLESGRTQGKIILINDF